MPLPNIRELFHLVPDIEKVGGEHVAKTLEHDIPANIAQATTEATGQHHSIENITPGDQNIPLGVLNPSAVDVSHNEEKIDEITPDSYKRSKAPAPVRKIFKLFGDTGKDLEESMEQHTTGKSYRDTDSNNFLKEVKIRDQADHPLENLEKAA